LEARSVRHRERDLGHKRALKAAAPAEGLMSRLLGSLDRGRRAASQQLVLTYDLHELKDTVCRLADGALGRIAVRETDGIWVAVCVPD